MNNFQFYCHIVQDPHFADINSAMHKTIKGVTADVEKMQFNTVISKLMIYCTALRDKEGGVPKEAVETLVLLLSPLAPHVSEECWQLLGHKKSLAYEKWPEWNEALCAARSAVVAIQVNGKVRCKLEIEDMDMSEVSLTYFSLCVSSGAVCVLSTLTSHSHLPLQESMLELARGTPTVAKWLEGKQPRKIIYVKGKIMNILV